MGHRHLYVIIVGMWLGLLLQHLGQTGWRGSSRGTDGCVVQGIDTGAGHGLVPDRVCSGAPDDHNLVPEGWPLCGTRLGCLDHLNTWLTRCLRGTAGPSTRPPPTHTTSNTPPTLQASPRPTLQWSSSASPCSQAWEILPEIAVAGPTT